jgi:hypothetical protein
MRQSLLRTIVAPVGRPVKRRLEAVLRQGLDVTIRSLTKLTPIAEFMRDDVFIVGFPRSGHTWFQNIVAGVVYGVDPEYAPDTLVQGLVPDVHYERFYKRFGNPNYFKSHNLPRSDYRHVVYLLRDGRDAMVSYFHFNRVQIGERVDLRRMVVDGEHVYPARWHRHVEAWLANPYDARMLVVRYEDLRTDPVTQLRRFCAFAGLERSHAFLEAVAANTAFEKMQDKERRFGWDDARWPAGKPFVRRGEIGSYKDEMPPDVLTAFMSEAGATLAKLGYR